MQELVKSDFAKVAKGRIFGDFRWVRCLAGKLDSTQFFSICECSQGARQVKCERNLCQIRFA